MTSNNDVENLFSFIDDYILMGGNSIDRLISASVNKPEIISICMIKAAAAIDVILVDNITTRKTMRDCLGRAMIGAAGTMATSAIEEAIVASTAAIPGIDIATALVFAGMDCYTALIAARDFEDCMRTVTNNN